MSDEFHDLGQIDDEDQDEWDDGRTAGRSGVPEHIGRFDVHRELSRDTMGIVYLGRDPEGDQPVMITRSRHRAGDQDPLARHRRRQLETQAKVSNRMRHAGVLAVVHVSSETDDEDYIVNEYLAGARPLAEFCRPDALLPLDQALSIACQCATTLDAAHRMGIVHRDIQPRNILVTEAGVAKLRGFSLATLEGVFERTAAAHIGSAVYQAPEQIKGQEASAASDLFSLGVVIYEMLTGVHPFMSNVIPAIGQKITSKAHRPLHELRPEAPLVLERILDRALKKHPAGRYHTALDLAGDLALVLDEVAPKPEEESDERRLERIRDLVFFKEFSEAEILEVIAVSLWLEFDPGERIIAEGDPGDSFYIIVDGEVEVVKNEAHIDELKRGDCFGEIGFITRGNRSASVDAREFVTVMEIRARLVERISMTSQIRFQRAFLEIMANRLTRATQRIASGPLSA